VVFSVPWYCRDVRDHVGFSNAANLLSTARTTVMPGRRNLAREQAQHALEAPARFQAVHHQLTSQLPSHDVALVGWPAILRYCHDVLQLRRLNGDPLTARIVKAWRRDDGFPLLRGHYVVGRARVPALTTVYAVTAWTLSRFATGMTFAVNVAQKQAVREAAPHATQHAA
jgi:hypothetical protein